MAFSDLAFIDSTGYHFADYPSFLAMVQADYRAIYGADTYLEADSQDGQWVAIQAKYLYDAAANGAAVYNSFSPSTAQGVGLARNVKINGISRRVATKSTVDLVVVGQAGTNIINGVAIDSLNQKWNLPSPTLIPGGGTITVTAMAAVAGAVAAQANTINRIFTPTLGWQTVNNPAIATPGVAVESDSDLRKRQAISTANPSLTVLEGTIGAVANVSGVTEIRGYENDTGSTDANGIPAHSFSLVVSGGATIDVAETIARHKTPGTRTYGTTSQAVTDSRGMPLTISFYRPTNITINVQVVIAARTGWTTDYLPLIRQSIADTINAIGIGNLVLITKLYSAAYLFNSLPGQTYDVESLEIAAGSDPLGTVNIPIAFNEVAFCDATVNVNVVVA